MGRPTYGPKARAEIKTEFEKLFETLTSNQAIEKLALKYFVSPSTLYRIAKGVPIVTKEADDV